MAHVNNMHGCMAAGETCIRYARGEGKREGDDARVSLKNVFFK